MKKLLLGLIGSTLLATPVLANESKLQKGFYSMDALGCMLLRECTEDVQRVKDIDTITNTHPDSDYSCLLYTSPSPRDVEESRMPSSA